MFGQKVLNVSCFMVKNILTSNHLEYHMYIPVALPVSF